MTVAEANPFAHIKSYERGEFERLGSYLDALDADGWVEQSYCTDWRVYQVVSHIGSGSRIGRMRLEAWAGSGPPVTREMMQSVWGLFDSLGPDKMLGAYSAAVQEYLAAEAATPDEAGLQEVDGFAGRRPISAYQLGRVWELACHSWDIVMVRDAHARFHPEAVALLAPRLQHVGVFIDKERAAALTTKPIVFSLADSGFDYTLDPGAERPRLQQGASSEAPRVVEGPDEEVMRFVAGRHFVPGTRPELKAIKGTTQDLANLRRAFR
jgi:uncharacterized protein (TIGR03083 family)